MGQELVRATRQTLMTTWEDDIAAAKFAIESSAYQAIEAGRLLSDAKEKHRALYGGKGWQQAIEERGINVRTADELIQVYRRLGNSLEFASFVGKVVVSEEELGATAPDFSVKALRKIAAASVPQEAVEEFVERAKSGERITVASTEEIIAQAKAEAKAEQLAADREEMRSMLHQSNDRVGNLQAVVDQASAARRQAEKQVADLELRIATGPTQRLKEELEDAQDKLYKEKARVDGLEVALIGERNMVRELRMVQQTSDSARTVRQLFTTAATRATAALAEVASYDIDTEYFIAATWATLETLRVQMSATLEVLDSIKRGASVVESN
jgi:hypothetical protein